MRESPLLQLIRIRASELGTRLFRNNVGMAWTGQLIKPHNGPDVLLKNPRPLHAGLCVGSSDLIGWTRVTVTPQMVGKSIAIFLATEVKTSHKVKVTPEQQAFLDAVNSSGAIGILAYSVDEFELLLKSRISELTS